MIPVLFVYSYFVAGLALLMFVNGVVSAITVSDGGGQAFVISAALLLFAAGCINLAIRGSERRLRPRERFSLAFAVYLTMPLLAALPILVFQPQIAVLDAYFETVSGLTTTGWSVLPETDTLPTSIVLWRSLLQWMGGAMILLIVIFMLSPARVGGLPDSQAGPIDYTGNYERQRVGFALSRVLPLFIGATMACLALLALTGIDLLDAFVLSTASLSTSGFTARTEPIGDYLPDSAIWIVTLFSTLAATSFLWLRRLLRGEPSALRHRESYYVIITVGGIGFVLTYLLTAAGGGTILGNIRDGFSIAASIVTTSGLETRVGGHSTLPYALLLILVFVGGSSFSTAGGIKMFRVGAMAVQSMRELIRLVYPHAIRAARFGTQTYNIQIMKSVWSLLFAALFASLLAACALGFAGLPVDQAILGGFGAVSNMAVDLFADGNQLVRFETLPIVTKGALCFVMIVGRLEVLAALAVLFLPNWRG
ncbi:potassium transporter TrkG [Tepidamorphus sp. 3E244]|uniref:potassium transporter TrkG n=1 Tax=Tepidamorphus sp. 3E244 TaxID=3385498 RepID=UPI0038FCDB07